MSSSRAQEPRASDERLAAYAEQRGADGFGFDDLARVAASLDTTLTDAAAWLAGAHESGFLFDLGFETGTDSGAQGPRRYCVATAASAQQRVDVRLPAVPTSVRALRVIAERFAGAHDMDNRHDVALAVSEAATNAVRHAYVGAEEPGHVRLVACAEPERLVVVVRDWGDGMRPRPDSPGLGLGLPTIAQVAHSFNVEAPETGGTLLRMHFAR